MLDLAAVQHFQPENLWLEILKNLKSISSRIMIVKKKGWKTVFPVSCKKRGSKEEY